MWLVWDASFGWNLEMIWIWSKTLDLGYNSKTTRQSFMKKSCKYWFYIEEQMFKFWEGSRSHVDPESGSRSLSNMAVTQERIDRFLWKLRLVQEINIRVFGEISSCSGSWSGIRVQNLAVMFKLLFIYLLMTPLSLQIEYLLVQLYSYCFILDCTCSVRQSRLPPSMLIMPFGKEGVILIHIDQQ